MFSPVIKWCNLEGINCVFYKYFIFSSSLVVLLGPKGQLDVNFEFPRSLCKLVISCLLTCCII